MGLRLHSLAVFGMDLSPIVLGVVAPHYHLMMYLKLAKPNRKASKTFTQAMINHGL